MVYASISSLLPNILLIDVTLLCWFRTCCTEKTKRKKDTENNKCHSLNLKKKREFPLFEKEWVSPVKCHDYTMFVY